MNLEIERRWLIESPLDFHAMKSVWKYTTSILEITQFYRKSKKGITDRVRYTADYVQSNSVLNPLKYKYYHTLKKSVSAGISEEEEKEITEVEAEALAHRDYEDPKRFPILKTRYNFTYDKQHFELDVFKDTLEGLTILELEVDDLEVNVNLPKFLSVVKEVTYDKRFKNSNLAKLQSYKQVLEFY